MPQLILTNGIWMIDLIAQNDKRDLSKLFHTEEGIKFDLGLDETFVVFGVNEEDNAGDFWEVILPKTTSFSWIRLALASKKRGYICTLLMSSEIESGELDIANCELLRC